jgi:hypothetical protein
VAFSALITITVKFFRMFLRYPIAVSSEIANKSIDFAASIRYESIKNMTENGAYFFTGKKYKIIKY